MMISPSRILFVSSAVASPFKFGRQDSGHPSFLSLDNPDGVNLKAGDDDVNVKAGDGEKTLMLAEPLRKFKRLVWHVTQGFGTGRKDCIAKVDEPKLPGCPEGFKEISSYTLPEIFYLIETITYLNDIDVNHIGSKCEESEQCLSFSVDTTKSTWSKWKILLKYDADAVHRSRGDVGCNRSGVDNETIAHVHPHLPEPSSEQTGAIVAARPFCPHGYDVVEPLTTLPPKDIGHVCTTDIHVCGSKCDANPECISFWQDLVHKICPLYAEKLRVGEPGAENSHVAGEQEYFGCNKRDKIYLNDVRADSDCLFTSVANQLLLEKLDHVDAKSLRENTVDQIAEERKESIENGGEEPEKREEREGAFDVLLFEEQWVTEKYPAFKIKNGEDYLKHMRIPKQMYGGHYELLTLAKLYKVAIIVWTSRDVEQPCATRGKGCNCSSVYLDGLDKLMEMKEDGVNDPNTRLHIWLNQGVKHYQSVKPESIRALEDKLALEKEMEIKLALEKEKENDSNKA